LGSPLHTLHGILSPGGNNGDRGETTGIAATDGSTLVSDSSPENMPHATGETDTSKKYIICMFLNCWGDPKMLVTFLQLDLLYTLLLITVSSICPWCNRNGVVIEISTSMYLK
jgi:hypothetical protein